MHILLVADGRSPIARRWAESLIALQHRVSLISTFPCSSLPGVDQVYVLPVAFGALSGSQVSSGAHTGQEQTSVRRRVGRFRNILMSGRYWFGPLTAHFYRSEFLNLVKALNPDIVHALRIPFEGMLATFTPAEIPMVVSIWGNDLTFHANGSRAMTQASLRTLARADGLMADAQRDIRLGRQWGFAEEKPTLVVPGAGGVSLSEIRQAREDGDSTLDMIPPRAKVIINPRGFRPGSVRNDVFFQAIPLVIQRDPDVFFICAAMAGQNEALDWIMRLKLENHVRLLPYLPQSTLWDLFIRSLISVSVSEHDGTPNSLLEAMACGCFPIAGDIESLREWITPGVNGILVEPTKPEALADAIILALENPGLRATAAERNLQIIAEKAETNLVRAQVQVFYQSLINQKQVNKGNVGR
ncbi:MAG TPA: glycosyltransferase [Longilinea sp.]|nr:glycosyltransferase [Longilinea sp.]